MNQHANIHPAAKLGRRAGLALLWLGFACAQAFAATDISQTPIITTTAAAVKPNVMLLMDSSDSMAWTHMPDEVESITGTGSVGYKSAQCNALYYDPKQTYLLPKKADGSFFDTPAFDNARYAGFGDFYVAPDTSRVDLSGASATLDWFRAYDNATLKVGGFQDNKSAAYYYKHSSGATLDYKTAPCTDIDTGATRSATTSGTWTRVTVGAATGVAPHVDERQNFAIWYSYYRTRIALTKSAASLAFTPLTDTYRVGFITVQPKDHKEDVSINGAKYLEIADFNAAHRADWFQKLFSQSPYGASPAREGLARVGRHYAGLHDSINVGMTGDPLQYSCQQNFTIMTTDGYWNTQTETPDTGSLHGGPLEKDGATKIGQADGDDVVAAHSCPLSDPYCPRPIHDGNAATTEVSKDATNFYDQLTCGLSTQYRNTYKTEQRRTQWTKSFTKTQKRTRFYRTTTEQNLAKSFTITQERSKTKKTTEQYVSTVATLVEEHYKIEQREFQTKKTSSQSLETRSQAKALTYAVQKTETTQHKVSTQYVQRRTQFRKVTVQNQQEKRRYSIEKQQTVKRQFRVVSKLKTLETYTPSAECGDPALYDCIRIELPSNNSTPTFTPVEPTDCAPGTASTFPFVHTECSPGPLTVAKTTTASCTIGPPTSSMAPDHVVTICTDEQIEAPKFVATCSPGTDGSNVRTICTLPSGPNNAEVIGPATCTADPGTSSPFVHVSCPYQIDETTYPSSPCTFASTTDSDNITTTCEAPTGTNYNTYLASGCSATSPAPVPGQTVTCTPETVTPPQVVDPASCPATGDSGTIHRSCDNIPAGAYPTETFVASCAAATDPSTHVVTSCIFPSANNQVNVPKQTCGNVVASSANDWLAVTCSQPPATNFVDQPAPANCSSNPGDTSPFIKADCTRTQTSATVEVGSCTPDAGLTGPTYTERTCTKIQLQVPTPVTACTDSDPSDPNHVVCSMQTLESPVLFCNVGTTGPSYNQTTCSRPVGPNNAADVPVAFGTCVEQDPIDANSYVRVRCNVTSTFSPAVVDATACVAGTNNGNEFEYTTCTRNDLTSSYVETCTPNNGSASPYVATECSQPAGAGNTTTPQVVPSCSPVGGYMLGANAVKTFCSYTDTNEYVSGPGACVAQDPDSGNLYVDIKCSTATSSPDVLTATCSPGTSGGPQPETSTCVEAETLATTLSPPCSSGIDTATNENVTCTKTRLTGPIEDTSCVPVASPSGSPWTIVECTPGSGSGLKLRRTSTITTTTSRKSGSLVVGVPTTSSATGDISETACAVPTDPLVAVPSPNPSHATTLPAPPGACSTWPCLISSTTVPTGSENSLADVASYYYKTDLRTDNVAYPNNVKPTGTGPEDDKATHQHMTTFVVGLGVSGTLNYRPDYKSTATTVGDFANIRCPSNSGCLEWPVWPNPAIDYSNTDNYNDPKSIDDFWHTAVNGRGTYFNANNPAAVVSGLGDALSSIDIQTASGAAEAASSFEPTLGNNSVFTTSYQTGRKQNAWIGNLDAYTIDLSTGALSSSRAWSARDLLDAKVGAQCDNRNIYLLRIGGELTSGGGQNLVNFAWDTYRCDGSGAPTGSPIDSLNPTEKNFFGASAINNFTQYPSMTNGSGGTVNQRSLAADANLVNFLRGQRGHEDYAPDTTKFYRKRSSVLGDLIGSQPVYVAAPFARYQDTGYGAFITANLARTPMVYVGGNDGMLHAFDAATGQESWSVIPQAVIGNLYKLADDSYWNNHQFFVDGSPVVSDVFDGSNWRTILVGGLNAGGKAYYALDVTNPTAPKALWEFRAGSTCASPALGAASDCNLGLTFGRPIITKVDNRWVVMFTSGYNNINGNAGDGGGFIYTVDAVAGTIIDKIATGEGSASDPGGLAQINNFVENTLVDNTTVRAYGGDLLGNIWRFTFAPSPSVNKIGVAKDLLNNPQPITIRPEVAELDSKPIIFIGTGKLLGSSDLTDPPKTQSIYGIVDTLAGGTVYGDLRSALRPLVLTQHGTGATATRSVGCTAGATPCARPAGWAIDLPESGERVNVQMNLNFGTLVVASNVPKSESCTVGGHSWFNYFDFRTGAAVDGAALVDPADPTSDRTVSQYIADSLVVGFNIYKLPPPSGSNNGRFSVGFNLSNADRSTKTPPPPVPLPVGKRISWREIVQ